MNGLFLNSRALQRGSVTLMAVVVMAVVGLLGAGAARLSSTETDISANYCDGVAAQQLAEAGVQHALVVLKNNRSFKTTDGTPQLAPAVAKNIGTTTGTYAVQVVANAADTQRTITSTGSVGNARRVIVTTVNVGNDTAWDVACFGNNGVTVNGSGVVVGGFATNGTFTNTGTATRNTNSYVMPTYLAANYSGKPSPFSGNINSTDTVNLSAGTYYKSGGVSIGGTLNCTGNVIIFVNGSLGINTGAVITGNVMFICTGALTVDSDISGANVVLVSTSSSDSAINGNARINGAVLTKGKLNVNGRVTYSAAAVNEFNLRTVSTAATTPNTAPLVIESWKNHTQT